MPSAGRWLGAATLVAVVALAVNWLPALRDSAVGLDAQRKTYAGTIERTAREQCAHDQSRPDLVASFGFIREHVPENAGFLLRSRVLPCLALNVAPRVPVPPSQFDAERHWIIYDQPPAELLRRARAQTGRPVEDRDLLTDGTTVVLAPPGSGATP